MVYVDVNYNAAIHDRNLRTRWYGDITLKSGTVLNFDMSNINDGSGELTMRCSSDSAIELGGGYAAELRIGLKKLEVDRYLLIDGIISLYAAYIQNIRFETWDDIGDFSFDQIGDYTWADTEVDIQYRVAMGLYIIKEAMRTSDCIKVTAYDYMIKLDKDLPGSFTEATRTAYKWLLLTCTACGLTLGMTQSEVWRLPNGDRALDFANVNTEVSTYRDLVIQLATACGAVAVIGRDGKLKLRQYRTVIDDAVGADFRYMSEFSDYQSYYTGLYATFQEEGVTEYHRNTDTAAEDTGLVMDLGVNSFLQITTESKRKAAGQAVIDCLKDIKYVPFDVSMPFNPAYEPMDILRFYDNQTEMEDIAPVTKIVFRCNDKMTISCGGANPALNEVSTRESKAIERVSSDVYSGDQFWLYMDNAPDESAVSITAKNTPTKIGEVLFYAAKEKNMLNIAYTATFMLEITTLVRVKIYVDDTLIYTTEENMWPNENRLTVTTGYELDGKGSHSVSAWLEIDDSTLDVGGGGVLMEKSIATNGLFVASDDGVYGYSKVTALIDDSMGYYGGLRDVTDQHESAVFEAEFGLFDEMDFEGYTGIHEWQGPGQVISYDEDYVTVEGEHGVELIIHDYSYTGSAATIDEGYMNTCVVPSDNYSLLVEIDAYDSARPDVFSLFDQNGLSMGANPNNSGYRFIQQSDGRWVGSQGSNVCCEWSIPIPAGYRYLSIDIEGNGYNGNYNLSTMYLQDEYGITGQYGGNFAGNNMKTVSFMNYTSSPKAINEQSGVFINSTNKYSLTRQTVVVDISQIEDDMYIGWHRCDNTTTLRSIKATL